MRTLSPLGQMTNRQKFTVGYEPEHRRMEVEIETSKGKMTGTITADPNMPPETMKALTTMMGLLGEMAMRGELNAILKEENAEL